MPATARLPIRPWFSLHPIAATMAVALVLAVAPVPARPDDRIKELQTAGVANQKEKVARPYHFGSQGPNDVFSNHGSHTNRMVPVYVFGRKAELGAVTGKNSLYRDSAKIQALYGFLPENTVNPDAEYADQSDLYRVQRDAVRGGSGTCSSSGSTASTGRPRRPPRSSRPGRSTPRGRAQA